VRGIGTDRVYRRNVEKGRARVNWRLEFRSLLGANVAQMGG
jgi:hypothetical protein